MNYKYITEDNLENKQNYMYSELGGENFLNAYIRSRKDTIEKIRLLEGVEHNTYKELSEIWDNISDASIIDIETRKKINLYVKSFEVRKRLYAGYDENWKPSIKNYRIYGNYLTLCEILVVTFEKTDCTKYVSCLLKLTDSLISVMDKLDEAERYRLMNVLNDELLIIARIQNGQGGVQ